MTTKNLALFIISTSILFLSCQEKSIASQTVNEENLQLAEEIDKVNIKVKGIVSQGNSNDYGINYIYEGTLYKISVSESADSIIYTNQFETKNYTYLDSDKFIMDLSKKEKLAYKMACEALKSAKADEWFETVKEYISGMEKTRMYDVQSRITAKDIGLKAEDVTKIEYLNGL